MPILIWIATTACMLEIARGQTPDQSRKDLQARSDKAIAGADRAAASWSARNLDI
jgi:hypothetical protein